MIFTLAAGVLQSKTVKGYAHDGLKIRASRFCIFDCLSILHSMEMITLHKNNGKSQYIMTAHKVYIKTSRFQQIFNQHIV